MAKLQLNQVLAIEKSVKSKAHEVKTYVHHTFKKPDLLGGLSRTYQPINDDGEKLPEESKVLQVRVPDGIAVVEEALTVLFDTTLQKEDANTKARADVEVDGNVLLENVPATGLLWLEKELVDVQTFVKELPTLSADEKWEWDDGQSCYRSVARETTRTKKVQKPLELAPATDKHPAQVQLVADDELQGYWSTIKYSGALPKTRVDQLTERVEKLLRAVKQARQKANLQPTEKVDVGAKIFGYLFAD